MRNEERMFEWEPRRSIYGVFIVGNSVPMALFLREDWARDFANKMMRRNPSAPLEVVSHYLATQQEKPEGETK